MPKCEACGNEAPEGHSCPRCWHPALIADAASLMGEAADLNVVGQSELAISKIQKASKLAPDSWIPHLMLAEFYYRKSAMGESSLERLADREFGEALRLGPLEKEVHASRIVRMAKRGAFELLRAEYSLKAGETAIAKECLRMIDSLEQASKMTGEMERVPPPRENFRAKMFLVAAMLAMVCTFGMILKMITRSRNESDYIFVGGVDFWMTLGWLTAAMALGLEFLRASGKLKK